MGCRSRVFLSSAAVERTQSDDSGCHFPRCVRRTCPQVLWLTRRKQQLHEAFIFLIAVIATFFSFLLVIQWGPGCRRLHNVLLACVSSTRAPADMCAGHSGENGTQNHLIASFRLPRCWERRENGNPFTHAPNRRIGIVRSALALSQPRAGTFTRVPRRTQISV